MTQMTEGKKIEYSGRVSGEMAEGALLCDIIQWRRDFVSQKYSLNNAGIDVLYKTPEAPVLLDEDTVAQIEAHFRDEIVTTSLKDSYAEALRKRSDAPVFRRILWENYRQRRIMLGNYATPKTRDRKQNELKCLYRAAPADVFAVLGDVPKNCQDVMDD